MNAFRVFKNEGQSALVFFLSATLSLGLFSSVLFSGCFWRKPAIYEKPILVINGVEISTKEFSDRLARRLGRFDALYAKDDANLARAKEDTVTAFILEVIAKQFAEKNKISVSKEDVDTKVREIRSRYPDDFAFRRALSDERLSLEAWRADLEFTILQKKIFQTFQKVAASGPPPTEAELKGFYDSNQPLFHRPPRVRLRQVVLEKEDDAGRILEELAKGAELSALAKNFSVAPEGKNGGDTGWLDKGILDVFDQAFKMPIGSRSKILKSPYGYHIYEVIGKEAEGRLSFVDAKDKIRAQLLERSEQKLFSGWLEEQVRKSSVKRDDGILRSIKVTTRGN
jgi:peptidyl-prolyl cis-trans isomerase C